MNSKGRRVVLAAVLMFAITLLPAAAALKKHKPRYAAQALNGPAAPTSPGAPGFWMAASDGSVFSFGSSAYHGGANALPLGPNPPQVVGLLPTPSGNGYWLAAANGGVYSFGGAKFLGSAVVRPPGAAPIVAIAGTPDGAGYWLVASDASVYTLGDATYWGRPPASAVHAPIVGAAASPSGEGYYLVAADGSVYPEGDAWALGDASSVHLGAPIVGMATSPDGKGYYLVGADGGVLTYGDAHFAGSTGAMHLNQPITGLTPTSDNGGYWLTAADGGVFNFGNAPFLGSAGGKPIGGRVVSARSMPAAHAGAVAIFYYPWYGNPQTDGAWRHWDEGGHSPPDDIGSDYYPSRGAYSSNDPATVESQMGDIAAAGINEVVVSWWGQGSYEDKALPVVLKAAQDHGITVGIHLEPYVGRNPITVTGDFLHLTGLGINDIWVYMADQITPDAWAAINAAFPNVRTMAESGNISFVKDGGLAQWAAESHFQGVYLYDAVDYEGRDDAAFCGAARAYSLVCAPVAAPGFREIRATGSGFGKSRENGFTYDRRWMGVLGSRPDVVAITSYNEWHEGSQIEPAIQKCLGTTFCYANYEGAYGTTGTAASYAYLNRTQYWIDQLRR